MKKFLFYFTLIINPFLFLWLGILNRNIKKVSYTDFLDGLYVAIFFLLTYVASIYLFQKLKYSQETKLKIYLYFSVFWIVRVATNTLYGPLDWISIGYGAISVIIFHYVFSFFLKKGFDIGGIYGFFLNIIVFVAILALVNRYYTKRYFKSKEVSQSKEIKKPLRKKYIPYNGYHDFSAYFKKIDQFLDGVGKLKEKPNIYYLMLEEYSGKRAYEAHPNYRALLTQKDRDLMNNAYNDYKKRGFNNVEVTGMGVRTYQAIAINTFAQPYTMALNPYEYLKSDQYLFYRIWQSRVFKILSDNGYYIGINEKTIFAHFFDTDQYRKAFPDSFQDKLGKKNFRGGYIGGRVKDYGFVANQLLFNFFYDLGFNHDLIDNVYESLFFDKKEKKQHSKTGGKLRFNIEYYNFDGHYPYFAKGCSGKKLTIEDMRNIRAKLRMDYKCGHPHVLKRIDEIQKEDPNAIIIVTADHPSTIFTYAALLQKNHFQVTAEEYTKYPALKDSMYMYYLPEKYKKIDQLKNVRNTSDTILALLAMFSSKSQFPSLSDEMTPAQLRLFPIFNEYVGEKNTLYDKIVTKRVMKR